MIAPLSILFYSPCIAYIYSHLSIPKHHELIASFQTCSIVDQISNIDWSEDIDICDHPFLAIIKTILALMGVIKVKQINLTT